MKSLPACLLALALLDGGRGAMAASLAWIPYEAEAGKTNASVHGPSREYLTPESESSGRRYVRLAATGDFVEIRVKERANAMVIRYCIPDSADGGGADADLSLYRNGTYERKLRLTSRNTWVYGNFPWSNDPKEGKAHYFYDETAVTTSDVEAGDVIRLQKDAGDEAEYYLIDLVELEHIAPPLTQPPHSLSITEFGAIPNDAADDSAALVSCLAAARKLGKSVWIPEGEFLLNGARIPIGGVQVRGAGMWYSKLTGNSPLFAGTGETVEVSDLAIFGHINQRRDESPDNAFNGNFGSGSVFKNLWIEHVKCGFWTTHGTVGLQVEGCRIRNTMADGLNFCDGTSHSVVRNCHLRNTGDDALATWSPSGEWSSHTPCVGNHFLNNTIQLPWHANGIALYGGSSHLIAGNTITGTVYSGGGILISSGFGAIPFSGTIRVRNNTITDAGSNCYIGEPVGSLWIDARDSDIPATISVNDLHISDPATSAITVHGRKKLSNFQLRNVEISRPEK